MRVWALLTQKGGAAKSTSSINLAVLASELGERALIIDCDAQRSAAGWWESREADDSAPMVVAIETSEVRQTLEQAKESGYTHVFIDTPGHAGLHANQAAQGATLCVIPVQPSIMDMRATVPTADMLKSIERRFAFVLTRCPIQGSEIAEASQSFSALGLVCKTACMERKAYKRAYAMGLGVTEFAEIDKQGRAAAQETRQIYQWLVSKEDRLNAGAFQPTTEHEVEQQEAALA